MILALFLFATARLLSVDYFTLVSFTLNQSRLSMFTRLKLENPGNIRLRLSNTIRCKCTFFLKCSFGYF